MYACNSIEITVVWYLLWPAPCLINWQLCTWYRSIVGQRVTQFHWLLVGKGTSLLCTVTLFQSQVEFLLPSHIFIGPYLPLFPHRKMQETSLDISLAGSYIGHKDPAFLIGCFKYLNLLSMANHTFENSLGFLHVFKGGINAACNCPSIWGMFFS